MVRRDRQADGLFYYAVQTTEVYCRPSRPARPTRAHRTRRAGIAGMGKANIHAHRHIGAFSAGVGTAPGKVLRVFRAVGQRSLETATPDSWYAWLLVAAAFLASFVVFGIMYSFGIFFEPMAAEFQASRAATAAFFSLTGFTYYMLGALAGHLSDRFGPRMVVGTGALVMGAGLVLTAGIGRMWIGYLTYGIGVGVGAACAYVPTLALISGWVVKRRHTALGLAAAGTGCGTLLGAPLAAALIERYGWRLTAIIFGGAAAALLLICAAIVAPAPLPPAATKQPLGRVVRSFEFIMLYVSWVCSTTALFVPFVLLPSFARDQGATPVAAAALLSLLGGISILSRLGIGVLGDRLGTLPLFKVAVWVMGVSYAVWLTCPAYGGLLVFVALLGLGYGARIALMPGVLLAFFGLQKHGAILGLFFTGGGIAAVVGPLLAGGVVDYTGSYRWGITFALAMGLLGCAAIMPVHERVTRDNRAAAGAR